MSFIISLEEYLEEPGVAEVQIPDCITKILNNAIPENVTSVMIPKSVTEIENDAFAAGEDLLSISVDQDNPDFCDIDGVLFSKDKTVLVRYPRGRKDTEFIVPDHVAEIGYGAFEACEHLTSVRFSNHVEIIGPEAFQFCGLTSIDIPASVTTVCKNAFANCNGLTSVIISEGVTEIESRAFVGCEKLKSVSIPRSVTTIYPTTFWDCYSLTSVVIPDSVTEIADDAFRGCNHVTVLTTQGSYADDFARRNNFDVSYISAEMADSNTTELKIPDSTTEIAYNTLPLNKNIADVLIPKSVTEIAVSAFDKCIGLTSITVDSENPSFCDIDGILYSKDKTVLIRYPRGRKDAEFVIPEHVNTIRENAFFECEFLTSVVIPDYVTEIQEYAFTGCKLLSSVSISNSINRLNPMVFAKCKSLTHVTVPDSVTSIGDFAFRECTNLASVFIPDNVTKIAKNFKAFINCPHLTITAPRGSFAIEYAKTHEISFQEI